MGIFLPEKILIGVLSAGLTTIKADLTTYIPDIFDVEELGSAYIDTVSEFLANTPIAIKQGYPLEGVKLPGWFVVPASSQEVENFIGGYGNDQDIEAGDVDAVEISSKINQYQVKIITASMNGDVTLMLDAICRYILLLGRKSFSEYNMNEFSIQVTDYDPVYQFLPQEYLMRSTMVSFNGMDTWVERFPLIKDVQLFVRFNPTEEYIEIP